MSIERNEDDKNKFDLICDCCSYYEIFFSFDEAVEFKKENGWKSKRINGEWNDFCEDCKYD